MPKATGGRGWKWGGQSNGADGGLTTASDGERGHGGGGELERGERGGEGRGRDGRGQGHGGRGRAEGECHRKSVVQARE